MTDKEDEIERLKRQREMLIEAERQDQHRLAHSEVTLTEREALRKSISGTMEKRMDVARRLYELGVTKGELGGADA